MIEDRNSMIKKKIDCFPTDQSKMINHWFLIGITNQKWYITRSQGSKFDSWWHQSSIVFNFQIFMRLWFLNFFVHADLLTYNFFGPGVPCSIPGDINFFIFKFFMGLCRRADCAFHRVHSPSCAAPRVCVPVFLIPPICQSGTRYSNFWCYEIQNSEDSSACAVSVRVPADPVYQPSANGTSTFWVQFPPTALRIWFHFGFFLVASNLALFTSCPSGFCGLQVPVRPSRPSTLPFHGYVRFVRTRANDTPHFHFSSVI